MPKSKNKDKETRKADNLQDEQVLEKESEEQDTMKDELEKLDQEYKDLKNQHLRLFADFENHKKHSRKQLFESREKAFAEMAEALLPVIDDFERAIKSMQESEVAENVLEGIDLIYNKTLRTLKEKGIVPFESVGKVFDPEMHEAVTKIKAPSDDMKGKVVDELEKGYILEDRIIRYAKVVVGE